MQTIVYQSFRTNDVPPWIESCQTSVRNWAAANNFRYHFYDDIFFTYAPADLRRAVRNQRHLVSDLARLELAHELLQKNDRVIWIDADVYINKPEVFLRQLPAGKFIFCKELWLHKASEKLTLLEKANNCVMVFEKGNSFLDFYRYSCRQIIKERDTLRHDALGTLFLTEIHKILQQPLLDNVGIFSPELLLATADNNKETLDFYRSHSMPMHAANLCLTFYNASHNGRKIDLDVFNSVIRYLDNL